MWYEEISKIYVVEDNLYTDHDSAWVFPEKLDGLGEEDISSLKYAYENFKVLRLKMQEVVDVEIARQQLEEFIHEPEGNTYPHLNNWYNNGGRNKWEEIWELEYFRDEYEFLTEANDKIVQFTTYQDAITHVITTGVQEVGLDLWILDRELGAAPFCDLDILNLLDALSSKKNAIGIVYSAKTEGLQTRRDIHKFVHDKIMQNKPDMRSQVEKFVDQIKESFPQTLFTENNGFIETMLHAVEDVYKEKIDIRNLLWVTTKPTDKSDLELLINSAKHGFQLFNLIKAHTNEQKSALTNGLLHTTTLDLEDIEYLKVKAIEEGINISEMLVRIHDIYSTYDFKERLASNSEYKEVIKNIENWEINTQEPKPNFDINDLLSKEKFDVHVNKLFNPVMTGDIFKIYLDGENQYYMLITQECDCVVRKSNKPGSNDQIKRNAQYATLVKIKMKNLTDPEKLYKDFIEALDAQDVEQLDGLKDQLRTALKQVSAISTSVPIYPFKMNNGYKKLTFMLRNTLQIDFKLLDLCTLNESGETKFNLSNLEIYKTNIKFAPSYYRPYLLDIVEKLQANDPHTTPLTNKASFTTENRNLKNYTKDANIIDFYITRITRLKMPYQAYVQTSFGLTQSNIGLPTDLIYYSVGE